MRARPVPRAARGVAFASEEEGTRVRPSVVAAQRPSGARQRVPQVSVEPFNLGVQVEKQASQSVGILAFRASTQAPHMRTP